MKFKLLKIILLLLLIGTILIGCQPYNAPNSNSVESTNNNNQLTIVTSFYPIYISALNVTKDVPNVTLVNMTKPNTGCLHDYQMTPADLKTLEAAKVFIINGANMEAFMDKVVAQLPNLNIIEASKGIELLKNASDGEDNPHVWVSISNDIVQVQNIGKQLAAIDPKNADKYLSNAAEYVKKLETERDKMHKALDSITNRDIITFHEAFPYFAKEFNLKIAAVIEREPGSEPSAGELADTIKIINEKKVKALFAEPQYSTKATDTIARETGAKVYMLDPIVTGPMNANAYIDIMDNNLKILEEALK